MCREGTWCDALIVQAVANAFNLRINIVESGDGFSELTVVECQHSGFETRRSIVLGHVDEYHYVSTISLDFCGSNVSDNECERVTFVDEQNADIMLRELPRGRQLKICGAVVNVPANVNSTVSSLPRAFDDSYTVAVKLKRRLAYKHHYQFEVVRPKKVLDAARYLVNTSSLFKNEGIVVCDSWIDTLEKGNSEEWSEFFEGNALSNVVSNENTEGSSNSNTILDESDNIVDDDDGWCEAHERPSGVTDTLLQESDPSTDVDKIINVAPGEGSRPLGLFIDKDSEFLAFPSIFCGKRRCENKDRVIPVHYSTICKWELRNRDRRVAQSVSNIFYKLKKLQIKRIQDTASLSLRKCKTKGKKFTAGDLKCPETVNRLIQLDEGFRVLKDIRGSPAFFERCKKDLFAMIRQLGNPTWFCSFSAAETRWNHLLKILGRLVDGREYTDCEINEMNWQKKSELIQKDPVSCARNFDYMIQRLIHDVLKSEFMPVGEIADFFYRVEFQQRGSPHIHALLWIKNAPQYEVDTNDKIVEFIDKYLTCVKNNSDDMVDLINLQTHRHAKTCKKKGQKICRFNFPLPPMRRTMILSALTKENFTDDQLNNIKDQFDSIKQLLDDMKYGDDITFDEFLIRLGLSEESYITAIRFSLSRDTVLLKRAPSEIRVNSYNTLLLRIWQANMDMQYVLDPYACAVYILSYITKGQRGICRLLEAACEEAKSGNQTIRDRVRHIGNKFLNAVEISAQEAVYMVLQMPLRRSSRSFQFINTSNPDERVFLLKTMDKIKELADNSEDIESDNLIKRYQRRPRQLENVCLADFAAWYNYVKDEDCEKHTKDNYYNMEYPPERGFEESVEDDISFENDNDNSKEEYVVGGGWKLVKRTKSKIIRSVRFHRENDSENYYREQLMLYTAWRNESKDLIGSCESYCERFQLLKFQISQARERYEYNSEMLEKAMECLNNDVELFENVASCTQHNDEQDEYDAVIAAQFSDCFDADKERKNVEKYNLLDDFGCFPTANDHEELLVYRMDDNRYRQLVRLLNREQMEFFYHVLHSVKTTSNQMTLFLSGGAGCGKTTVTNCLYECLIRYFNSAGENPDEMKVLKVAPTGKAAFIINGNTLHSAFKIPVNRGFEYRRLDSDRLNTMRSRLKDVRVIFIDEVSMVGSQLFQFLNSRLQEVMNVAKPFGGVDIITVGDLFQLKPVFDKWIFENSLQGYGCLASNIWQEYFRMYELTKIMRQKDDKDFAELLNRVREGKHTDKDINILQSRVSTNDSLINVTHVYPINASVDCHNRAVFEKCTCSKARIKAIDVIVGDLCDELKERMKEKIPNDPSKTMGLFSVVDVAEGLKYDLTTNICVLDGMTNGAEFILKKIDYRISSSVRPSILWVLFQESNVGQNWRARYVHLYNNSIDKNWTPLLEITRHFTINKRTVAQVMRRQFPLRAAAGKTIHRCQGDTLNEIVIEFPASRRDHMHYVGLSRVRNLSSLHILKLNEKKITVSEKVVTEMARLRKQAMLEVCVPFLYSKPDNTFKILFHNVRSLPLHFKDVETDYSIKVVDVAIFVETVCILCYTMKSGSVMDWVVLPCDHIVCIYCVAKSEKKLKNMKECGCGEKFENDISIYQYITTANCGCKSNGQGKAQAEEIKENDAQQNSSSR
ncbi:hypothetical protein ACROYT_G015348 [Oculina patagonica]